MGLLDEFFASEGIIFFRGVRDGRIVEMNCSIIEVYPAGPLLVPPDLLSLKGGSSFDWVEVFEKFFVWIRNFKEIIANFAAVV